MIVEDEFESVDGDREWDAEFAADLLGCTLLAGLSFVEHDGTLIRREQHFGRVVSADPGAGIVIRESDGTLYTIAPVLDAIEAGEPGLYQLSDSDAVVENPDFVMLVTGTAPRRS